MRICGNELNRKQCTSPAPPPRNKSMNRQKILESWERFALSVRDVAEAEWTQRKVELFKRVRTFPGTMFGDYPLKQALIACIPATYFMLIFQFFPFWNRLSGQDKVAPFTGLPAIEHWLFGCLPHEVMSRWTHPVLDCLAAFPYLIHFLLPFYCPAYCFYHRAKLNNTIEPALRCLWIGGSVAGIGVTFHLLFPNSPPWFNETAVYSETGEVISRAFNEAGFQRIDAMIHLPLFREIYGNAPCTHGSFPSLHAAFPFVIFLNGGWVAHGGRKFAGFHVLWISWAALYSHHHYLIDILGGQFISFMLFQFYHNVWNPFRKPRRDEKYSPLPLEERV